MFWYIALITESGQGFISGSLLRALGRLWLFLINWKDRSDTSHMSSSCLAYKCDGRSNSNYITSWGKSNPKPCQQLHMFSWLFFFLGIWIFISFLNCFITVVPIFPCCSILPPCSHSQSPPYCPYPWSFILVHWLDPSYLFKPPKLSCH